MAIATQNNTLNIQSGSVPVTVHLSQGDVGNTLGFYIYNGSEPVLMDGYQISVHGIRQDGVGFGPYQVSKQTHSNYVYFNITNDMTSVRGAALAELTITNGSGASVGTANFAMLVERGTFPNGPVYDTDISVYQQILNYVQTIPASLSADIADLQSQTHDTVADMKADTNLKTGIYVRTGGYYAVNDGGGALYRIYSAAPATHYELLTNGLYAELIIGDSVSPEQFGAYGDGATDDTDAIAAALAACDTVIFSKKYKITRQLSIDGKHLKGCGHIYPTGNIFAFGVTDISKQTTVEAVTFHCDNGGGVSFNCLTTDGSGNPKPYTDYTPRQSALVNVKFVCDDVRGTNKFGVKMIGAVDSIIESCGFYGCGVYIDSSINVGINNTNFIDAEYGVYYATVATSNQAYTCGLRLVSCNIVGCTTGVYSNNTDVILIDSCMIDYAWTAINLIDTIAPMIINSYITAYDYCVICNNTPYFQMSNCNVSDHTNTETGIATVIFDLIQIGKGLFNGISFNTSATNIFKVGTVSECVFNNIVGRSPGHTATLFYNNNLASSCSVSNISLKASAVNIGTGKTARMKNVLLTDYVDSFEGSYLINADGTESTFIKTIDEDAKLVNSGAIIGTVAAWRGNYSIAFSKSAGTITVVFDPTNLPSGNLRVTYKVF